MAVKTFAEYKNLLREVLDELAELRASIEYDEEFMGGALEVVEKLEPKVREFLAYVESDGYQFGRGEVPFMEIVKEANSNLLPFKFLFSQIEKTHKQGLEEN
jgi:hypothetical protein